MDIDTAFKQAQNPKTTSSELEILLWLDDDVDLLIARHQNATSSLLDQLIDQKGWDSQIVKAVLQNANISQEHMLELGRKYPAEMLKNPSLESRLLADLELLTDIPEVLSLSECPEFYIRWAAKNGNLTQKISIRINPIAPKDIQDELSPKYFVQDAAVKIKQLSESLDNADAQRCLVTYSQTSLPYCLPKFLPFDRDNLAHRFEDQLICGFPFTSKSWPWPKDQDGNPMQPLVQLDLVNVSKNLGLPLGEGLLQVWNAGQLIRIIPIQSFNETLDTYYPEETPWTDKEEWTIYGLTNMHGLDVNNCRIEWIPLGKMYPSFHSKMWEWAESNWPNPDKASKFASHREFDALYQMVAQLSIPQRGESNCFMTDPIFTLGGWPSTSGNDSLPIAEEIMILNIVDDLDVSFSWILVANFDKSIKTRETVLMTDTVNFEIRESCLR